MLLPSSAPGEYPVGIPLSDKHALEMMEMFFKIISGIIHDVIHSPIFWWVMLGLVIIILLLLFCFWGVKRSIVPPGD